MKLEFYVNGEVSLIDLDSLSTEHAGIINIGRKCKQVWNAVKIDDESVDPFQCNIIGSAGTYKLNHGQERTECPKGLLSSRLIPCNLSLATHAREDVSMYMLVGRNTICVLPRLLLLLMIFL